MQNPKKHNPGEGPKTDDCEIDSDALRRQTSGARPGQQIDREVDGHRGNGEEIQGVIAQQDQGRDRPAKAAPEARRKSICFPISRSQIDGRRGAQSESAGPQPDAIGEALNAGGRSLAQRLRITSIDRIGGHQLAAIAALHQEEYGCSGAAPA